ncbi:hypothetical protein BKI52_26025 [marine bacterium AO1-C]|nr:hypothetical protein BKI52_26025 [marine bacterium AO1-C]
MIKPRTYIIILLLVIAGLYYWHSMSAPGKFNLSAHLQKYNTLKTQITHQRDSLRNTYKQASKIERQALVKHSQSYLQTSLGQKIFPYWYGTRWSYSGTTSNPRKGKIACGYFVTTTLQHAGFKLNRYYLAQQAASVIIKRLCKKNSIKTIGNNDAEKLITYLRKQPDGIYILGLDTHVGFIEKRQGKLDFIHSSYSSKRRVVREPAINSNVISNSSIYVVGNLLANEKLVKYWLLKKKV